MIEDEDEPPIKVPKIEPLLAWKKAYKVHKKKTNHKINE
jgi:hypothetical protein